MSDSPLSPHLEHELHTLRQELANLRAIQSMHQETRAGLEALELQLASIIHSAMDGIITIDEDHRVVLFNAAAEQIFHCSADEAVGKTLDQFLPPSLRKIHRSHIHQFAESGESNRRMNPYREVKGVRLDGEEFPLEASISQVERSGKNGLRLFSAISHNGKFKKIIFPGLGALWMSQSMKCMCLTENLSSLPWRTGRPGTTRDFPWRNCPG